MSGSWPGGVVEQRRPQRGACERRGGQRGGPVAGRSTSTTAAGRRGGGQRRDTPCERPPRHPRSASAPPIRVVFLVDTLGAPEVTRRAGADLPDRDPHGLGAATAERDQQERSGDQPGPDKAHLRHTNERTRSRRVAGGDSWPQFGGISTHDALHVVQASLHFASVPPERRILGQMPGNGGPRLLGRIPRCIRGKRRLFQR